MNHFANQRTPDRTVMRLGRPRLTFSRRTNKRWRCNEHYEWGLLTQSQVDARLNQQFPKHRLVKPPPKPAREEVKPKVYKVARDIHYDITCPPCNHKFYQSDDGLTNCPKCSASIDILPRPY